MNTSEDFLNTNEMVNSVGLGKRYGLKKKKKKKHNKRHLRELKEKKESSFLHNNDYQENYMKYKIKL